jgi:Protein of unknown function (DUF2971)
MAGSKILYKYVSADGFKRLWESEKVRFTQLGQLNDPYENKVINPIVDLNIPNLKKIVGDNLEMARAYLSIDTFRLTDHNKKIQHEFDTRWGVLSLSRNPKNLLMWSHYANEHRGVVVGIDVSDPIFYDRGDRSIVFNPKTGNVIYSAVKPKSLLIVKNIERVPHEKGDGYSTMYEQGESVSLDETFLYKAIDWAYEDEVRIVRDLHQDKGEVLQNGNQEICLFPLPKRLIKSVIFGERYDQNLLKDFAEENSKLGIQVFRAMIDSDEYKIKLDLVVGKEVSEGIKSPINMKGVMPKGVNNNSKKKKKRK